MTEAPEIPSIESMSSQVVSDVAMTETPTFEAPKQETPKEAPKVEAAPKADAKPNQPPKPEAKAEVKPEVKKEAAKDDSLGDDYKNTQEYKIANSKLRKTLDRFAKERDEWKGKASEFETSRKTTAEKVAEYEAKIKAIEGKPVETKTDTALIEKYENQIKELKQTVREYDYQKSDEFREKFSAPFEKAYKKAVGEVTQLTVTKDDQSIAATDKDFAFIRSLPFGQRRAAARQMFGEDSDIVLGHVARLEEMRESALEAIASEKQNYELKSKETSLKQQREQEEYGSLLKQSEKEILETIEDFKLGDDPEEKKLWEKGLSFVEHALNNTASLPANERAAHAAATKMRAALYDLQNNRVKAANAKIKSLTDELSKFRSSDPGNAGEKGEVEKTGDEIPDGIEAMLA